MIQVIYFDKRKFINTYCNYKNNELTRLFKDLKKDIKQDRDSIIEISFWNDKTGERK